MLTSATLKPLPPYHRQTSAMGTPPPPLTHADVLNGWSLSQFSQEKKTFSLHGTLFSLQGFWFHYRDFPEKPCTSKYEIAVYSLILENTLCFDFQIMVMDLRTVSFDVPPQEILTRDSVTVAVDAVVYYRLFWMRMMHNNYNCNRC